MSWIAVGVGVATTAYGAYSKGKANKKQQEALSKRKAYTTQDETFQILNALENRSQGDTQTRDFQTQQIDNSFAQQLGVAELLGADANDLSGMFQQKMQGILQVGQQFHASNMEAFGKYIGGLDMVAKSKDAEYASQQNIVKDQLQAAAADSQAANATINSGINTALAGFSAAQSNKLYKDYQKSLKNGTTGTISDTSLTGMDSGIESGIVGTQSNAQGVATAGAYTQDAGFLQWLQNNGIGTKR